MTMARRLEAHTLLCGDGRVLIRSAGGRGVRALERALRSAGVGVEVNRTAGGVLVTAASLRKCRIALDEWDLRMSKDVEGEEVAAEERLRVHEAALAARREANEYPEKARARLSDYERVDALDPHQVTAVALACHSAVRGLCIFDEQGLGKTVEALFAFDWLRERGTVGRALVFAPKNMVLEWVRDVERFFGSRYRATAVVGTEGEKRAALDEDADLFVTNFETAVRLEIRLRQLLEREKHEGLLIVDESFFVKNSSALRAQALRRLRRYAGRCLVLCGTPAPNSAVDLVEQFSIADDGMAFEGVSLPSDREAAARTIADTIERRGVYIRRLKGSVLPDLPSRTFTRVLLPMPPQQRRLYDSAFDGLVDDVRKSDESTFRRNLGSFMARRVALLQICSNPASRYRGEGAEGVPAKISALDEILEDLIARRKEKVVLWSYFRASLNDLVRRYEYYGAVRVDGSVPLVADRREAVRRFQDDDETMLFVGNPAAAGAGLTLHRARYAVYESMSNQAAHYLQSLDRIHRRGQDRPVEYLILLCDETIEPLEYGRILRKESAAQALLNDRVVEPVTREAFLNDLLGVKTHDPDVSARL